MAAPRYWRLSRTNELHQSSADCRGRPSRWSENEAASLSVKAKRALVEQLTAKGLSVIEAGSFVSPQWVPQMAGSDEVFRRFTVSPVTTYTAFTPNIQGLQRAIACDVREIAVFAVASDCFSRKNINRSIAKSLQRFASVVAQAQAIGIAVRGYISRVLGCP